MAKKTPLQAAAAAQDEAATEKKKIGVLASLAALLGLEPRAAVPSAKTSKHTVTTKRVEMHEGDDDEDSDGGSMSTDGGSSTGGSASAEAEEEEGSAEEEEESAAAAVTDNARPVAAVGRTVARPVGKAYRAALAAADAAFLAAFPAEHQPAAALRMPSRVVRMVKEATGEQGTDAALGALSALPQRAAAHAKIEADVNALKANDRKRRIDAIVDTAKAEGRAGATTAEGRASLRAIGMSQGSKFLRGHVAQLPIVARTTARLPKAGAGGEAEGAPSAMDQRTAMERGMAGLSAEERKEFEAIASEKLKGMNGAARTVED